jgi:hypothetical protein
MALYWAASSDDVEVARALIDAGADIEAPGASIAGGAPLDDAVGYGAGRSFRRGGVGLLKRAHLRAAKLYDAVAARQVRSGLPLGHRQLAGPCRACV